MKLRKRTILGSAVLTVAVALVIGLLAKTVGDLRDSAERARHSETVLAQATGLEKDLLDMETGIRGYLITRRQDFLQPYLRARSAFPAAASRLMASVAEDPMQKARAAQIKRMVASYTDQYVQPLIAIAMSNPARARSVSATTEGKRRVDAIRSQFGRFIAQESLLARQRADDADASATRANVAAGLGLAGLIALVAVLTTFLTRAFDREERTAARERVARERARVLARASEVLAESLEHDRTLAEVTRVVVPDIADWCALDLAQDDGPPRNVAVAHVDPRKVRYARELSERYPPDPEGETGAPNVIRTGRSELYPEIPDELLVAGAQDEEHLRIARELGLVSAMTVPLVARDRTLGALTLVTAESGRHYDEDDLRFAEDLGRRIGLALDNALLYEREQAIAETLQRSLLPQSLPKLSSARVAARYIPAELQAEVGGDWYDVIELPDGRVELVIGDVVGHGVAAATTMGQLRSAVRAYALEGHSPAETINRLKAMLRASAERNMVGTALVMRYDQRTRVLEYASAGHPPALVREADGTTRYLDAVQSPPLGVELGGSAKEAVTDIAPGAAVVLYTDGLVERRGETLAVGFERLEQALAHEADEPGGLLEHVLMRLQADEPSADDVAVLVLVPAPEPATTVLFELPASRNSVTSARRAITRWLADVGASEIEQYELGVAVSDACANAVEHAYGPEDAMFEIEADLEGDAIVIEVRDFGSWRAPRGENRGRGLKLMEAFTDSMDIDRASGGTIVRMRRQLAARAAA